MHTCRDGTGSREDLVRGRGSPGNENLDVRWTEGEEYLCTLSLSGSWNVMELAFPFSCLQDFPRND